MPYRIDEDLKIYSTKTKSQVAELENMPFSAECKLIFQPGMVMQHKKKLTAFIEKECQRKVIGVSSQNKPEAGSAEVLECGSSKVELPKLSELKGDPPFDKYRGVRTPGFPEWAAGKSQEEITAMVRKLER